MSYKWKTFLFVLTLFTVVVWLSVFSFSNNLKVVTCDVGQGDATLIIHKSFEVLIDGGPDGNVINCLSSHMPFWDRTLEVVILTHPQADHYVGLIEVFERYKVKKFLANSLKVSTLEYDLLLSLVLDEGSNVINPTDGMSIRSHLIQLDILHPSTDFLGENLQAHGSAQDDGGKTRDEVKSSVVLSKSGSIPRAFSGVLGASTSSLDPNEFSIVTMLSFGSFKFLFTGDASTKILDDLALEFEENGQEPINYIKIPHHGSKNSISEKMYGLIDGLATISVGKNSYGHPSEEALKILRYKDIKILRTDEIGDIVIETDGKRMWAIGNK